ncbi:MAG: hypothetical protein ABIX37_05065 [Gammaproteobacteria bacterium]
MRLTTTLVSGLALALIGSVAAAQGPAADATGDAQEGGSPRATFDAEICKVDGLTSAQCDCAWKYLSGKLSPGDLKLAMLLTASSSEDKETARKAYQALDKNNASDKRKDALASEASGLVIEAEDSCNK